MTMSTVGYGDVYAVSKFGQICTIRTSAMGIVFESMFLVAWQNFIKMDEGEKKALVLLARIYLK